MAQGRRDNACQWAGPRRVPDTVCDGNVRTKCDQIGGIMTRRVIPGYRFPDQILRKRSKANDLVTDLHPVSHPGDEIHAIRDEPRPKAILMDASLRNYGPAKYGTS
jgi:hypothetical protein